MRLFIKTPRPDENKYIPHLLEHCVLQANNVKDFIGIQIPIYASTATGYTEFEFEKTKLKALLEKLDTQITQDTFNLQQKIIQKELKGSSFGQKAYIDSLRKISGNRKLNSNSVAKGINFKDIVNYQKNYYTHNNMILVNEQDEIAKFGGIENSIKFDPEIKLESEIKYKQTKFQGEIFDNIYTKYKTPYDIIILDFLYNLINDYTYYLDTKKGKYRYDYSDISITDNFMIINFEKGYLPKNISKEFFEYYKKAYIKNINKGESRNYIPIIALFTGYYISKKQHAKFIENIDIKTIKHILKTGIIIFNS